MGRSRVRAKQKRLARASGLQSVVFLSGWQVAASWDISAFVARVSSRCGPCRMMNTNRKKKKKKKSNEKKKESNEVRVCSEDVEKARLISWQASRVIC
mmetsp:Transcript_8493/g.16104  ORF Transcript_8493/g.16104 Transcript_8493/m.16104 type:complete len:98 (-) Transcript_8493:117-410(-)